MKITKKLILSLVLVFALNVMLIVFVQKHAESAAYRRGDTGTMVTRIQQRLAQWDYYNGSIDGIFGSRTQSAVTLFQRRNGLTVDGIVGAQTLAALGISDSSAAGSSAYSNDVSLLARLISAEARGEPYSGQVAVGAVVLNRMEHPSFPSTMSGVIYQSGAFTCLSDGQFWTTVADSAYRAARDALNGWDPSGGAIYYYNPSTATSAWIWSRPVVTSIGSHTFCM